MGRDQDEDRPKKSWREIDQQRDGTAHRRDEKPSGGASPRTRRSQAYRSYKSQLNKLFDGGQLPEALKAKLDEAGVLDDVKKKKALADAILEAKKPKEMQAALLAYRDAFGFPEQEDVLAKLLDLSDEDIVSEVIETLERLNEEGLLKRASSFKARLKTVEMTIDEPEIQAAAKALGRKLK